MTIDIWPGIGPGIRQGITAAMAPHVRLDRERHAGALAKPTNDGMEALSRHRTAAI
jgi:hypothetical protein